MGRGVWRRGVWRRVLVAVTCAGMAAIAAPATAGPPAETPFAGTAVGCYALDEGELILDVGAFFTPGGGVDSYYGFVQVGDAGLFAPVAEGSLESSGAFTLSYEFVDEQGAGAGTLVVSGTASPDGDPVDVSTSWREGNVRGTVTGTVRDVAVTGDIVEATGQLAGMLDTGLVCDGQQLDLIEWSTNPATRISHTVGSFGSCEVGDNGYLNVDIWGDQAFAFLELLDAEGATTLLAAGEVSYSAPTITGVLEVVQPRGTGESVSIALTVGDLIERGREWDKWANGAFRSHYLRYQLNGTAVVLPDGEELDLHNCVFGEFRTTERFSFQAGQKPGGKPPVNDFPDNALPIGPASAERVSTRGAAVAPEVPCVLTFEDGSWEAPFGRTVWYSFQGTGDEVTLTTQGSGFDTVMGVYDAAELDNAEGNGQVECVDDVDEGGLYSVEAAVRVKTIAGTTYLVQVGGFSGEPGNPAWGTVVVTRS